MRPAMRSATPQSTASGTELLLWELGAVDLDEIADPGHHQHKDPGAQQDNRDPVVPDLGGEHVHGGDAMRPLAATSNQSACVRRTMRSSCRASGGRSWARA